MVEQEEKLYRLSGNSTDGKPPDEFELASLPLIDFIPRITPFDGNIDVYVRPEWLAPGLEWLDKIIAPRDERLFFAYSAPRYHAKTTSVQIAVVKHLICWPKSKIAYYCHTEKLALDRSKQIRRVMRSLGFDFRYDADSVSDWQLETGGGLMAGPITSAGQGIHPRLVVIDDPYQTAEEARNASYRERVLSSIESDIIPMLPRDGALVLTHSRQHPKDAIGHYKTRCERDKAKGKKTPWVYLNQKALTFDPVKEEEVSIGFDAEYPKERLLAIRDENELVFETQYQGEPRTKSGVVFGDPARFDLYAFEREIATNPKLRWRVGYGFDCAYTEEQQRKNDWSVIVRMARVMVDSNPGNDLFYILDVLRDKISAPDFVDTLKTWWRKQRGPMMWLRAGGPEKGVADFIRKAFPQARSLAVGAGKYIKAEPLSVAWNKSKVLVPGTFIIGDEEHPEPPWVEDFIEETEAFTGTAKGETDDQVDAAAGAFHVLTLGANVTQNQPQGFVNSWGSGGRSRLEEMPGRGYG